RPTRTPPPTPTLPAGDVFSCIPPNAPRVRARVIQVYDGDTISVQMGYQVARVRYQGIDTPETKERRGEPPHPWGEAAKRRNRELVSGKWVTLVWDPNSEDRDHYGRLLRYVIVDDVFVNDTLLREGLAWYYPSEHACSAQFLQAEAEARAARRGLWSGATPTPIR
ncbi:MAG: thermonuclease family protein, partial [Chloroflexi bacterium]|nr:thermonuclease family protein [Chloroflexota bacterium]